MRLSGPDAELCVDPSRIVATRSLPGGEHYLLLDGHPRELRIDRESQGRAARWIEAQGGQGADAGLVEAMEDALDQNGQMRQLLCELWEWVGLAVRRQDGRTAPADADALEELALWSDELGAPSGRDRWRP